MSFPVLTAHQIYPYFFMLGGRLSPISIRDQMVRGQMLVEQAIQAGVIGGKDDRTLLVVGAGAAGATVAMCAAKFGVRTLIVDEGASPFRLQAGCQTRVVDPAQYDWPVSHWSRRTYPWTRVPVALRTPLPWRQDNANLIAASWLREFRHAVRVHPSLHAVFGTVARPVPPLPPTNGGWTFDFDGSKMRTRRLQFGMVVWTVGFGGETHRIRPSVHCNHAIDPTTGTAHPFVGFPFWSNDPFGLDDYRLPEDESRIVISGAGDGGLQDFLRVVAKPAFQTARSMFYGLRLPRSLTRHLLNYEERAQRAYHWGDEAATMFRYDHVVLQTVHDEHVRLARRYARNPSIRKGLESVLRTAIPKLHLVHSCTHFPNVYPLNRFLVLLIESFLEQSDVLIPCKRTIEVNSANLTNHRCNGNFVDCHGEHHKVLLIDAPYCLERQDPSANVVQQLDANAVIVRHGIDASNMTVPHLPDIPLPRQLPPFHVHI